MTSTASGPTPGSSPSSSEPGDAFERGLATARARLGASPLVGDTREARARALAEALVSLRRAVEAGVLG